MAPPHWIDAASKKKVQLKYAAVVVVVATIFVCGGDALRLASDVEEPAGAHAQLQHLFILRACV